MKGGKNRKELTSVESPGDQDRIPLALRWEQTLWEAMCLALWDGGQLS